MGRNEAITQFGVTLETTVTTETLRVGGTTQPSRLVGWQRYKSLNMKTFQGHTHFLGRGHVHVHSELANNDSLFTAAFANK